MTSSESWEAPSSDVFSWPMDLTWSFCCAWESLKPSRVGFTEVYPSDPACIDSTAPDFAEPVLLQQLLRAMQNTLAPRSRAVTFAVLSLLVRLVACQSSVFSLWYSRRSYERSRGEMITMLYEKTLSRQIVGESALSDSLKPSGEEPNHAISDSDVAIESQGAAKTTLKKVRKSGRSLRSLVWSRSPSQLKRQPASIGKIYNLMR